MAAPVGNRFWELRATHGRDTIFSHPDAMWEAACEYFAEVEDNPLFEHDYVGKDAFEVNKRKMRPFTYQGLALFCDVHSKYFIEFEEAMRGREDDISKGFSDVLTRIRDVIYTQKYEGAAAGFFNANLVSKDLGINEHVKTTNQNTNLNGDLTPEQVSIVIHPMGGDAKPLPTDENDVDTTRQPIKPNTDNTADDYSTKS